MTTQIHAKPTADKPVRPNKETVKGLPAHAQFQWRGGAWYVYFPYCFRENGVRKQERDYIGTISADGLEFKPNLYYVQNEPTFENRPPERWKNPTMRQRALDKLGRKQQQKAAQPGANLDPEPDADQQHSVGATALAAAILYRLGMVKAVASVLGGNAEDVMTCLNLAMHSALTTDKTYLAEQESDLQKFVGLGCPSSPRASEFLQRIGADQSLSCKMARACAANLEPGELIALDGTRVDSNSKNITLSSIGKKKDGTYGPQINLSLLINVRTGAPICYRTYAGNVNDSSTLNDLRQLWTDVGIQKKAPVILMDRGYPSQREFLGLDRDGFKFLISAKTSMSVVKDVINNRNCDFYDQKFYLSNQRCYGVKEKNSLRTDGHSMQLHSYVFRSPNKEMTETDELHKELKKFCEAWPEKCEEKSYADSPLLRFFKDPVNNNPLVIDQDALTNACYELGYFGFVGNVDISLTNALDKYRQRNEVEIAFKLMFGHLLKSTRVHSDAALEGLMMTTVVGLSILTYLRAHMTASIPNARSRNPEEGSAINSLWTIQELLKDLRRIKMAYSKSGQPRLINVVKRDRDLVEALGFPGLFDSAEKVAQLLSGKMLAACIQDP